MCNDRYNTKGQCCPIFIAVPSKNNGFVKTRKQHKDIGNSNGYWCIHLK